MTLRIRRSLRGCLLLVLLLGIMGANGKCDLAMQIWAGLQEQIDDNREQIDSQQQQIDQLTGALCELSVLTAPEICAPDKKDDDDTLLGRLLVIGRLRSSRQVSFRVPPPGPSLSGRPHLPGKPRSRSVGAFGGWRGEEKPRCLKLDSSPTVPRRVGLWRTA